MAVHCRQVLRHYDSPGWHTDIRLNDLPATWGSEQPQAFNDGVLHALFHWAIIYLAKIPFPYSTLLLLPGCGAVSGN